MTTDENAAELPEDQPEMTEEEFEARKKEIINRAIGYIAEGTQSELRVLDSRLQWGQITQEEHQEQIDEALDRLNEFEKYRKT